MKKKAAASPPKLFLKEMKQKFQDMETLPQPARGVYESAPPTLPEDNRRIELLLADIVTRLDRIEEKIDENVYPPESAIRPEFIRKVKKAQADIRKGKGKTYNSIDDFFREIEA